MDNLTHSLIGLAAAKAGLERSSPYAVPLCVIAANAPDIDILTVWGGASTYLHHHRGITHSIIGTLALALIIPLIFYALDAMYARWRSTPRRARPGGLLLASLITTSSHPLLDWTNNYGVRPFLPWNSNWYYGDLVFVIDPWLWLSLGGACFLLTAKSRWRVGVWATLALILTAALFILPQKAGYAYPASSKLLGLAGLCGLAFAYFYRAGERLGRSLPIGALIMVIVYWGALSIVHQRAFQTLEKLAETVSKPDERNNLHLAAMPVLGDPARWMGLIETDSATYRINYYWNKAEPLDRTEIFEKPAGDDAQAVELAKEDPRVKILMGFSRFPGIAVQRDCASQTLVQFADLRYTEPASQKGSFNLEVKIPR